MSGVKDYVSDGRVTYELANGHSLLESFSGSGCMLGAIVASFCGAAGMNWRNSGDKSLADTNLSPGEMLTAAVGG
jgi:hydroxyethylthiazole kinase-like sugar kinase family protein